MQEAAWLAPQPMDPSKHNALKQNAAELHPISHGTPKHEGVFIMHTHRDR
jgi:hypothetical protein